ATAIEIRGCSGVIDLGVTVTPALAPEVEADANTFNATKPAANGRCVNVVLTTDASADEAQQLPTQQINPPALWIPDSSLWARDVAVRTASNRLAPQLDMLGSLAASPLVLAAPVSLAHQIGWPAKAPSWSSVASGTLPTAIGNPATTTEGLAGTLMLESAMHSPAAAPSPALVALLVKLGHSAVSDIGAEFTDDGVNGHGVAFTASEQAVIQANQEQGATKFAAMIPKDGTLVFDYPLVRAVSGGEVAGTATAAAEFETVLRSASTTSMLTAGGFRMADSTIQGARAYPPSQDVTTLVRTWLALSLNARFLTVVDVSGSMNGTVNPNGETKAQTVRDATMIGLSEFPDTTEIGLWVFASQLAPPEDWREVVPIGLLGEPMDGVTRRVALQRASAVLPSMVHGNTALYATALAAYRDVLAGYDPFKVNAVVLMTDGFNDVNGPDLASTVATLRSWSDPRRPLPLFTIGIGPAADMNALRQLAAATNGRAYQVTTATDIVNVFLDVMVQRTDCRC
ncbi:MAG TPA: substrate-binding domain-containing protein, partial [Pseudonocardiaceae bacterium]